MSGLNQVRQAIIRALNGAGLKTVPAYEGAAKRYDGAVIAVDVGAVSGRPKAVGGYLGETFDPKELRIREVYGCQLDVTLTLDVWAKNAADCEAACEKAAETLFSGGLPSGLRLEEQSWEAISWDRNNQMFLRKAKVSGRGFFTASLDEEGARLIDFRLKGVLIQ